MRREVKKQIKKKILKNIYFIFSNCNSMALSAETAVSVSCMAVDGASVGGWVMYVSCSRCTALRIGTRDPQRHY